MTHSLSAIISEFNGYRESLSNNETGFREPPTHANANNVSWHALLGLLELSLLDFYRNQKVAFNLPLKNAYIDIYESKHWACAGVMHRPESGQTER